MITSFVKISSLRTPVPNLVNGMKITAMIYAVIFIALITLNMPSDVLSKNTISFACVSQQNLSHFIIYVFKIKEDDFHVKICLKTSNI